MTANRKEQEMSGKKIRRLLSAGTLAAVAMIAVPSAAFARQVGGTELEVQSAERTEGEKYANNYGFGTSDEVKWSAGRTPEEISTHRALAELHRRNELAIASQRTEGEKYANNYGFGTPDKAVLNRAQLADARRLQAAANAHIRRHMAVAEGFASESVPSEPSTVDGLGWGQIVTLTASLVLLTGLGVVAVVRNQRSRTAI